MSMRCWARMEDGPRAFTLAAFASVGSGTIDEHVAVTPEFPQVRALAIEAFYSRLQLRPVSTCHRRLGRDRLQHSSRHAAGEGLVLTSGSHERALRSPWPSVGPVRAARGRGRRASPIGGRVLLCSRSRAAHVDGGGLHALGGEGRPRSLAADPVRAHRRRCRWCGRPGRRPLCRRLDHDQHEMCARAHAKGSWAERHEASGSRSSILIRQIYERASSSARRPRAGPTGRRASSRSSSPASARARLGARAGARLYRREPHALGGSRLAGLPDERGQADVGTAHAIHDAWAARAGSELAGGRACRLGSPIEDGEAVWRRVCRPRRDGQPSRRRCRRRRRQCTLNTPQLLRRSGLADSSSSRLIGRNLAASIRRRPPPSGTRSRRAAGRPHGVSDHRTREVGHQHDEIWRSADLSRQDDDPGSDSGPPPRSRTRIGPLWGTATSWRR